MAQYKFTQTGSEIQNILNKADKLPTTVGTNGQVLTSDGTNLLWQTPSDAEKINFNDATTTATEATLNNIVVGNSTDGYTRYIVPEVGGSVVIKENAAACTEVGNGYIDANGHLQVLTSLDPRTFTDAGQIQGPAGTVSVGTVTTGAPGSQASVTNSGTGSNAILNFTIPQGPAGTNGTDGQDGQDGAPGEAATITIGTTTTGAAGSSAYVSNSGDSQHAVLNFTIPRGPTGATGATGPRGYPGSGLHKLGPYNSLTAAAQGIHDYFYQDDAPVDWTSKVVSIVASKTTQETDRTVVTEYSCEFHLRSYFDQALEWDDNGLSVAVWYQGLTVLPQAYDPSVHGSLFIFVCTE